MTQQEFWRIAYYMSKHYGIDLSRKKVIIEGRIENYVFSKGYRSFDEYMDVVEKEPSGSEAQKIIDILTTNHTYFFREKEHYDFLRQVILPELKKKEERTRNLRIWSAAASTGEEPYTIAMVIKDFLALDYSKWDTTILATDVSREVLTKALVGIYPAKQLEELPRKWIESNFTKINEEEYEVKKALKQKVIFRQFNLMDPPPLHNKLHVIFLRNVMIYFNEETRRSLISRMVDVLEPGGYLIIGMTEHIEKEGYGLEYVGASVYRKKIESEHKSNA